MTGHRAIRLLWRGSGWLGWGLLVVVLTYLSQVGGLVLLLGLLAWKLVGHKIPVRRARWLIKGGFLVAFLLLVHLLLVPPLARMAGRVPLPYGPGSNLRPLNHLTVVFSRHYVLPATREVLQELADDLDRQYPGTTTAYMDTQFPFSIPLPGWGRPLPPHITHDDGRKADISLFYREVETGEYRDRTAPSWIGYGSHVDPAPGERDRPAECDRYPVYNYMSRHMPQSDRYELDPARNQEYLKKVLAHPRVSRIYLEPHLVQRWGLSSKKIGLASCKSVRHDDHVHIRVD